MSRPPLGTIIAGGASSRYGSPKALALLDGVRIIDRVAAALAAATPDVVVIANDRSISGAVELDSRADVVRGVGVIAGVLTALLWARERGLDWVLAVACDMPFLDPALLRLLVARTTTRDADVIVPASSGPRGIEPLCAAYRATCIGPIRSALDRDDPRMIGFHRDVDVFTIPLAEVSAIGDPDILFMNVNTPEDMERATGIAGARA